MSKACHSIANAIRLATVVAMAAIAAASGASAQQYPTRPITLVVGRPRGGRHVIIGARGGVRWWSANG